ncbi:hypothetical protein QJS10_CPB22g01125 [Acorus calamus]|uniref:Uncharacterized protein n=1 Tax=Acorus calamus TaxID=4465 RepID=A0AAV9C129_ACOCL|nr:hypothetical protein QJS10_CPB22g01125 [Acorus calamus]
MVNCVLFSLLFFLFIHSGVQSIKIQPQVLRSFKIQETQEVKSRGCSYTVKIKTSCYSVSYTRDMISLSFGDAYYNQVYVPRLDDHSSETFERCSSDTYKIQGPCMQRVCYLYLQRNGWDGWTPEYVKIYGPDSRTVTFYYGAPIPNGVWYGFDLCRTRGVGGSTAVDLKQENSSVSDV